MTSIRPRHELTPEMIKYNEATKAQREEILNKILHRDSNTNSLEKTPETDSFEKPFVAPKRSKAKSIGKAIASFILPGAGQAFEGRFKDGLKDYAIAVGIVATGLIAARLGGLNFIKATEAAKKPYGWYASLAICGLSGIGNLANRIHSAIDAYKGGK